MGISIQKRRVLAWFAWGVFCLAVPLFLMAVLAPHLILRVSSAVQDVFSGESFGPAIIATGGEDGVYHQLGAILSEHVDALELEPETSQGSIENIERVMNRQAHFGFIQGALDFTTDQAESLRAVARIMPQYVHLVVPGDSLYANLEYLAGKRVAIGLESSGTAALAEKIIAFAQLEPPPVTVHMSARDVDTAFRNGEIDAAFFVYGLYAPAMENMLRGGKYRLASIDNVEALAQWIPGSFPETIPAGSYGHGRRIPPANGPPLNTLAVSTLLITHRDVSDAWINRLLAGLCTVSFAKDAHLTGFNEATARAVTDLPLHRAADKFYSRNDPITSDSFEIASFFLAGIVTLASTIHFVVGRREQLREKRKRAAIQPYFEKFIDYGEKAADTIEIEELINIVYELTRTLREAERRWLAGELGTEDMENLYAVCNMRSQNAYSKIIKIMLLRLHDQQLQTHALATKMVATEPAKAEEA